MDEPLLSIGEFARRSGVSAHTLRFYETAGVLKPAGRATSGHRRYAREDALWLQFVLRLKVTGMPLAEIKEYAILRDRGDATLARRLQMLVSHRKRLAADIAELHTAAAALDTKIRGYRKLLR
jgi:DNA-binding transcriptional MerR regulator